MKKASLFITGLVVTLSIGLNSLAGFQEQSLNRGDTGGAPADNRGDGGAPANFNKGDGGGISKQDSHADHF